MQNNPLELILISPLGETIDSVAWDNGETFPDPNGASMALLDPYLDNSIGSNWVDFYFYHNRSAINTLSNEIYKYRGS